MIDGTLLVTQDGLDRIWAELSEPKRLMLSQICSGVGDYLRVAPQCDYDSDGEWLPTGCYWITLTREQRKYLSRQAEQSTYVTRYEIVKSCR
jgi:hypothetical protein